MFNQVAGENIIPTGEEFAEKSCVLSYGFLNAEINKLSA
jgi:hypothetical protein